MSAIPAPGLKWCEVYSRRDLIRTPADRASGGDVDAIESPGSPLSAVVALVWLAVTVGIDYLKRPMASLAMRPPPRRAAIERTITATDVHPRARRADTARTIVTAEPITVATNNMTRTMINSRLPQGLSDQDTDRGLR